MPKIVISQCEGRIEQVIIRKKNGESRFMTLCGLASFATLSLALVETR